MHLTNTAPRTVVSLVPVLDRLIEFFEQFTKLPTFFSRPLLKQTSYTFHPDLLVKI
jgi:hypothetical protein